MRQYQGWESTSDEEARAFLSDQTRQELGKVGEWLQVALVRHDRDELIGDLGLCVVDEAERRVHLGFTLAQPAQGQGYATEGVNAVLESLFEQGYSRVEGITDTRNLKSIALLKRLGFKLECTLPAVFRGEQCEEHTFVLER
jgi:RimJ/RimL family protein N-acetyltransferase